MIRFPTTETNSDPVHKRPDGPATFKQFWAADDELQMQDWPFAPIVTRCARCRDTEKVVRSVPCAKCHGTKVAACCQCGQDTDCDQCDNGKQEVVEKCSCISTAHGHLDFSRWNDIAPAYVRKISRLDDVKWMPYGNRILFTFAGGGQGVCMSRDKNSPGYKATDD